MLNITNHSGNANQNHGEIPPPTHVDGYYQKTQKQVLEGCEELEPVNCWWAWKMAQPH